MQDTETIDNFVLELRRGVLALAVLAQLQEEQYGYSLINHLAEQGLEIDQGTLYPLMRRMENQGLLDSTWKVDGARPRRYYVLNEKGHQVLPVLIAEWKNLIQIMNDALKG